MENSMNNNAYNQVLLCMEVLQKRFVRIAPLDTTGIEIDDVESKNIFTMHQNVKLMLNANAAKLNKVVELLGYNAKYSEEFFLSLVNPRYLKYPECYTGLDGRMSKPGFVKDDLPIELSQFTFPVDVAKSQNIVKPVVGMVKKMFGCQYTVIHVCPLCNAIATGHLPSVRLFRDTIDPFNHVEFNGWTVFHFAAANGEIGGLLELFSGRYFNDPAASFKDSYVISYINNINKQDLVNLVAQFETYEGMRYEIDPGSKDTPYKIAMDNNQLEIVHLYNQLKAKIVNFKDDKEEKK